MRSGSTVGGIFALLCASAMLCAQQPGAPSFHSETQLVEIDVVANDGRGNPLTDLESSELHVLEDGKPRPISHFSLEHVEPLDAAATDRLHNLAKSKKPGVFANFTAETAGIPTNGCTL